MVLYIIIWPKNTWMYVLLVKLSLSTLIFYCLFNFSITTPYQYFYFFISGWPQPWKTLENPREPKKTLEKILTLQMFLLWYFEQNTLENHRKTENHLSFPAKHKCFMWFVAFLGIWRTKFSISSPTMMELQEIMLSNIDIWCDYNVCLEISISKFSSISPTIVEFKGIMLSNIDIWCDWLHF